MNIFLQTVISIVTLFLSAYLAYYFGIQSIRSKEKDEEKKKLKKLLYHLLIVRKASSEKLNFKKKLENINSAQSNFLKEHAGFSSQEISEMNIEKIVETQFELISSSLFEKLKIESDKSKKSIEIILHDYVEIDPLFSLSLKDYDNQMKALFIDKILSEYSHDDEFKLFQKFFTPHFEDKMVKEIDEVLHSITSKLDSKTQREVQELLIHYDSSEIDMSDFDEYLHNVIFPFKKAIENN